MVYNTIIIIIITLVQQEELQLPDKKWRTVCSNKFIGAPIGPLSCKLISRGEIESNHYVTSHNTLSTSVCILIYKHFCC